MSGKWRVLSSTPIVADQWIDLRMERCRTASGIEIAPYYVLTYTDWVHIVALTPADELVLVRQYRHGVGEAVLELPGGRMEPGEADPAAAAARELREETGFVAPAVAHVTTLFPNPALQSNRLHFLLATGVERSAAQELDPGEDGLRVELVPVAQVVAGLAGGLLGQAAHAGGLLLALQQLGRLRFG